MHPQQKTFSASDKLARTRFFMGGYWTFLATSPDTNGAYSLIEVNLRKGLEPPRHTHTLEDESFYLLQGEIRFFPGDEERLVKPGELICIPKSVPHHFKLETPTVKMLILLTPGGLEELFLQISIPADILDFPPAPTGPPSAESIEKIQALQKQYGIIGFDNSKIKTS